MTHTKGTASDSRKLIPVKGSPGIFKRGERYAVRLRVNGRQVQRAARTLKEARYIRASLTTDRDRGEYRALKRVRFADYAEAWLANYAGRTSRGVRPATLADYERTTKVYLTPRFGSMLLAEITLGDVRAFAKALVEKGLAPNTVRNVITPLRAMMASALEEGLIRYSPAAGLRLPTPERGTIKHLEPKQLESLYDKTPEEWRLWVRLLVYTGARIGEFVEVRWGDVDLDASTLTISRRRYRGTIDRPKSAFGTRTIPLTRQLVADLRRHKLASRWSSDADPIFATSEGTPHQPSNVSRRVFKPVAKAAGVAWASFHTLRHTCATRLAREGYGASEVQAWMGHHAASFSLDVYVGRPSRLQPVEALDVGSGS